MRRNGYVYSSDQKNTENVFTKQFVVSKQTSQDSKGNKIITKHAGLQSRTIYDPEPNDTSIVYLMEVIHADSYKYYLISQERKKFSILGTPVFVNDLTQTQKNELTLFMGLIKSYDNDRLIEIGSNYYDTKKHDFVQALGTVQDVPFVEYPPEVTEVTDEISNNDYVGGTVISYQRVYKVRYYGRLKLLRSVYEFLYNGRTAYPSGTWDRSEIEHFDQLSYSKVGTGWGKIDGITNPYSETTSVAGSIPLGGSYGEFEVDGDMCIVENWETKTTTRTEKDPFPLEAVILSYSLYNRGVELYSYASNIMAACVSSCYTKKIIVEGFVIKDLTGIAVKTIILINDIDCADFISEGAKISPLDIVGLSYIPKIEKNSFIKRLFKVR